MKRLIKICLLFIIVCTCLYTNKVYATDADVFSMTNASGAVGEEVTINIKLDKALEIASADLVIEYDTSKLEYVKYTALDVLNQSAMNIVKNNEDTGKIAIGYVSNPSDLNKTPGQMLSITFKIKSGETSPIVVNLKCTTLKKDSGEDIPVNDAKAEITVTSNGNNGNSNNNNNNNNSNNGNANNGNSNNGNANNGNSNNNGNNSNGNKNNSQIIEPTNNNPTTAKTIIPQTGDKISVVAISLILCTIISLYYYKKYIYLKNIK